MNKIIAITALLFALLFGAQAEAAGQRPSDMTASAAIVGTQIVWCPTPAGPTDFKCTFTQIDTFVNAQFSGDLTVTAGGVVTLKNTGPGATGPLGSATVAPIVTIDAQGRVTALSSATVTPAVGSITGFGTGVATFLATPSSANLAAAMTDETGTGANVFATSPTLVTPILGTPTSVTLTNGTGLPISTGVSGLGTGIASWLATPSSANLLAAVTGATGTGGLVFASSPTLATPTLGGPTVGTSMTLSYAAGGGTQCLQVSNTGAVTVTGAVCGGSGSTGANPTATASDTAVNGSATTFMRSDGAPAVQKASNSQFGVMEGDGSTISCTSGVCSFNAPINAQVGTTYAIISTDKGKIITATNASASAYSIAAASSLGSAFYTSLINEGAGLVTLTPTTSTIDGAASLTIKQGQSIDLVNDGTNYFTLRGRPTNVAASDLVGIGTNVAAAVNTTLSAAGGLTSTIAAGTSALGTSAIASAACATVVTTAATNTATTDVVTASFNGDPTAVTGYIPVTTGALTIFSYPTANNVNFKVCNLTSASITPGAITLNWRVVR
jgi:hypothetical protein